MTPEREAARSQVTTDRLLSPMARFLYLALDEWALDQGITATLTEPEIAAILGVSGRGVRNWLKELDGAGYLFRERGRRGYQFRLLWAAKYAGHASQERHDLPVTVPCERQNMPVMAPRPARRADHAVPDRQNMPVTAARSMPYPAGPDGQVQGLRTYVTDLQLSSEEMQKVETVRSWLLDFPGASALWGEPDDEIVGQCLNIADGDLGGIAKTLEYLGKGRSRPTKTWAWFPAVFGRLANTRAATA
jgi:hypothetical protein